MANIINKSALKDYIATQKIRINKTALNNLIKQSDSLTKTIIKKSKQLAKEDKRSTIMPRDVFQIIEQTIGKKQLTWPEITDQIINLGPIEISNISKEIDKQLENKKGG